MPSDLDTALRSIHDLFGSGAALRSARARLGPFKLLGPNGRESVPLEAPVRVYMFTAVGGKAPVRISFQYPARADAHVSGGFYEVAAPADPAGPSAGRPAAASSRSISFAPPRLARDARKNYATLRVRAEDADGAARTLSLTIDTVVPPFHGVFDGFEAAAARFSWRNCALLIAACGLADQSTLATRRALERYGFDGRLVQLMADPDPHLTGFAVSDERLVLLVFRGTDMYHYKNLRIDISFPLVHDRRYAGDAQAKVHGGFKSAVDEIFWPQVLDYLHRPHLGQELLKAPDGSPKRIWLAGHSLGAAIATLTAARLAKAGYAVQGVYAYGTPNLGNPAFKHEYHQRLGARHVRVINGYDPVPRLPLYPLYEAVGELWHIDPHDGHRMASRGDADLRVLRTGLLAKPSDHGLDHYWQHIRANAIAQGRIPGSALPKL